LQALRTNFVRDEAGGLQQAVLSADAVQLQMAVTGISGMQLPQDAAGFLAASNPSSKEWHTFASAPFDLFNDVLIRCKVRAGGSIMLIRWLGSPCEPCHEQQPVKTAQWPVKTSRVTVQTLVKTARLPVKTMRQAKPAH
jgi:hypothetical protein